MFQKVSLYIGGRELPGIQVTEPVAGEAVTASGRVVRTSFADVISFRETNPLGSNPGQTYLIKTNENLGFTTIRDSNIVGLDVSTDGTFLSLHELEAARGANIMQRQADRLPIAPVAL